MKMLKFFGVVLGALLLRQGDDLSRTLQLSSMSATDGQNVAAMTSYTLVTLLR